MKTAEKNFTVLPGQSNFLIDSFNTYLLNEIIPIQQRRGNYLLYFNGSKGSEDGDRIVYFIAGNV